MSERLRREDDDAEDTAIEAEETAVFSFVHSDDLQSLTNHLISNPDAVKETNKQGSTPLHLAAKLGRTDIVKYLVQHGHASLTTLDGRQNTPLHVACINGNSDIASFLIACKSDVHAMNKDVSTPLHLAAKTGLLDVCRILVMEKAAVESRDSRQFTPLHVAALAGQVAVAEFLANNCKADVSAVTDRSKTPAMLTRNMQLKDMLEKISGIVYIPPEKPVSTRKAGACYAFVKGECQFGDRCRFSHEAVDEAAPEPEIIEKKPRAAPKKKVVPAFKPSAACYAFQRGECDRGDKCRFSHSELTPALEQAVAVVDEEPRLRKPRQRKLSNRTGRLPVRSNICFAFLKAGCTNAECKFLHIQQEELLEVSKTCFAFRDGDCKWGEDCRFSHDNAAEVN